MKKLWLQLKALHREIFDKFTKGFFLGLALACIDSVRFAGANWLSMTLYFFGMLIGLPILTIVVSAMIRAAETSYCNHKNQYFVKVTWRGRRLIVPTEICELRWKEYKRVMNAQLKGQI